MVRAFLCLATGWQGSNTPGQSRRQRRTNDRGHAQQNNPTQWAWPGRRSRAVGKGGPARAEARSAQSTDKESQATGSAQVTGLVVCNALYDHETVCCYQCVLRLVRCRRLGARPGSLDRGVGQPLRLVQWARPSQQLWPVPLSRTVPGGCVGQRARPGSPACDAPGRGRLKGRACGWVRLRQGQKAEDRRRLQAFLSLAEFW